jgi:hypothetical protein
MNKNITVKMGKSGEGWNTNMDNKKLSGSK